MRLIVNSGGGGIAETLDASYYKGQGLRQGKEREFVVLESNQIHATITKDGTCPTLTASMGLGGGVCTDDSGGEERCNE